MRMLRRAIPSMFHRRLLLLGAVVLLLVGGVSAQLVRLAVVQGARRLAEAEQVLSTRKLLPTVRGTIYDRKGRVLARDEPCADIAVEYEVISGDWAYSQARQEAFENHRERWGRLSFDQREELIRKYRPPYERQVQHLWQTICRGGNITRQELEQRKSDIVDRVQTIRAAVWSRTSRRRAAERSGPVELADVAIRIREEEQAHTLLPAADLQTELWFARRADRLPGLKIIQSKQREYPLREASVKVDLSNMVSPLRANRSKQMVVRGLAYHIVGDMRDVWAEDVDEDAGGRPYRRADGSVDLAGYLPGDRLGRRGVERAAESRLRGTRGVQITDRRTGDVRIKEPHRGKDVHLTIDIHLQARIQALLDPNLGLMKVQPWHSSTTMPTGAPLNGAVTVLEVDSGQILAMVTSPPAPEADPNNPMGWPEDIDQPQINRPVGAVYPPGSTIKPIVYAIAARERAIQWDQTITCNGYYFYPDRPSIFRCWIYRPAHPVSHGPLGPAEAIARSCNIYFYTCGDRLGPARLVAGLREFGFGAKAGVGLGGESAGMLPSLEGPNPTGRELNRANAMFMGIGQGPIAATPMQVACAHAALARGGYWTSPVLMEHRQPEQSGRDLGLPPRVIDNVLEGMRDSANASYGTGHHINLNGRRERLLTLDGVTVRSKTGTAQAPVLFDDANENGRRDSGEPIVRQGHHGWYVCHVQRTGEDRAAYVIAVVVEYGGSGGRAAGPVANMVLHALRTEGYL